MNKEKFKEFLLNVWDELGMKDASKSEWDRSFGVTQLVMKIWKAIRDGEFDNDK